MMVAGPEREMELVLRDRALEPAGKGEALLGGGGGVTGAVRPLCRAASD